MYDGHDCAGGTVMVTQVGTIDEMVERLSEMLSTSWADSRF